MDMDRLVRRASEQLAARPSRRGIVSAVAKLAVGAGAIRAGLGGTGEAAAQTIGNSCCTGPRPCNTTGTCERGTKPRWSWYCTASNGARYLCQDCFKGNKNVICVYADRQ